MNLVHLKYAVEVAETGSINKASEKLYVSQPNLSRAIKELEASLGVTIFDRSAKGMVLTPDGEVFVRYARSILRQVDAIEEVFSKGTTEKKKFSISVPRASGCWNRCSGRANGASCWQADPTTLTRRSTTAFRS